MRQGDSDPAQRHRRLPKWFNLYIINSNPCPNDSHVFPYSGNKVKADFGVLFL